MYLHPQFQTDVIKPLRIDELMDQEVQHLSGGELQRVAITMCLGKEADLYLIDEPSAYLDSEQRIIAAKVGCLAASQGQAMGSGDCWTSTCGLHAVASSDVNPCSAEAHSITAYI